MKKEKTRKEVAGDSVDQQYPGTRFNDNVSQLCKLKSKMMLLTMEFWL
jgi:hypothetical protein